MLDFLLRIRWLKVRGVFSAGNSRISHYVILGLDPRISVMRLSGQAGQ
ncbi:hypothetical protein [Campylobacter sp.]|nr:hypothetical protein [Campylobacter sp.]MDY3663029.1 hypothetical protein [Campylobacter sp.]